VRKAQYFRNKNFLLENPFGTGLLQQQVPDWSAAHVLLALVLRLHLPLAIPLVTVNGERASTSNERAHSRGQSRRWWRPAQASPPGSQRGWFALKFDCRRPTTSMRLAPVVAGWKGGPRRSGPQTSYDADAGAQQQQQSAAGCCSTRTVLV
jgi:hypothetical protein